MTKIISVCVVLLALVSCKPKNEFEKPIKDYVLKLAGNFDIKYKPVSYDVLDTVTLGETEDEFWNVFPEKYDNDKDREAGVAKMRDKVKEWQADETMHDAYQVWSYHLGKYDNAKKGKRDDVDYYVVKHIFNASNPVTKKDVIMTRYYLIDGQYNVITYIDSDEKWNEYKTRYNSSKLDTYNFIQYEQIYERAKHQ